MSDFEKLKSIDIETIYQKTYMSHQTIECLFDKNFKKLNKFKTLGYIKILEKEFNLDLSEFKEEATRFFDSQEEEMQKQLDMYKPVSNKLNKNIIIAIGFLLLIIVAYFFVPFTSSSDYEEKIVANTDITSTQNYVSNDSFQQVDSSISNNSDSYVENSVDDESLDNTNEELNQEKGNDSLEDKVVDSTNLDLKETTINEEIIHQDEQIEVEKNDTQKVISTKVIVVPQKELWLGVIYLDDYSKKDYLSKQPIELDTSRNQLILAGHGHLKVHLGDKEEVFDDENRIRFLYQDGEFFLINMAKFKELNKGKNW